MKRFYKIQLVDNEILYTNIEGYQILQSDHMSKFRQIELYLKEIVHGGPGTPHETFYKELGLGTINLNHIKYIIED